MDLRFERTEEMLREAVIELAKSKDIYHLTVTEITQKARISRITFYDHYDNAEALIKTMEDEYLDEFIRLAGPFDDFLTDPTRIIQRIVRYYQTNYPPIYLHNTRPDYYAAKGVDRVIDEIINASNDKSESFRTSVTFAITGILGVFQRMDISRKKTISELANYVSAVIR